MSKAHSASKHLYTLNDSKVSSSDKNSSLNSSLSSSEAIDPVEYTDAHRQMQKLHKKNEDLVRMVSELQLKNQELFELNQLSQKRNQKHEEKQRDLIKKLSYFQVSNKQLTYQIRKISQDLGETRQNKKVSQNQISQIKQSIKKSLYQKDKFLSFLKNLMEVLRRCQKHEQFMIERDKILQFIHKNMVNSENNQKIVCEFDLKFQMSRVDTLKQKIKSMEEDIQEYKSVIQRQKAQKKKLISTYNQKITKLRQMYENLREKIEFQQQQSKRKIKNLLIQKNEMIQTLKNKLRQSRTNKNSIDIKKSRQSKKSFIGDGDLSHLQLNELNEAIEHLQMQIIKEFQQ